MCVDIDCVTTPPLTYFFSFLTKVPIISKRNPPLNTKEKICS